MRRTKKDRLYLLTSLSCLLMMLLLAACTPANNNTPAFVSYTDVNTTSLPVLEHLHQEFVDFEEADEEVNPIRLQGIKEAAVTLGAQGSLAGRSIQVNTMLMKNRQHLDQIFNFNAFLLEDNVLPPVIVEGQRTFNLADDDTIRIADKTYRIIQQARFATSVPNWREYLWQDFQKPEVPDPTLLPRKDRPSEIKAWKQYVREGWAEGSLQAEQIFAENLARLKRDYQGMALYVQLLNQNMISPPLVAKTELGITGGGDEMSINDRFKRITIHPSLQTDGKDWVPAVAQELTSLESAPVLQSPGPPVMMMGK